MAFPAKDAGSTILKPSREVGEIIGQNSSLESTVRRKGLLTPVSGVQNQPPQRLPVSCPRGSFTLCHCPLQHQMTANTPCTACSSMACQRSLQALLSDPSPGLLCHMLSLSEDQKSKFVLGYKASLRPAWAM